MVAAREWSHTAWFYLHTQAALYPDEDKHPPPKPGTLSWREVMKRFFMSFFETLPCGMCANHALEYARNHPLDDVLDTNENLQRYFYDMHNDVRKRNGQPIMHTFEEVKAAFAPGAWKTFGGYPFPNSPTPEDLASGIDTTGPIANRNKELEQQLAKLRSQLKVQNPNAIDKSSPPIPSSTKTTNSTLGWVFLVIAAFCLIFVGFMIAYSIFKKKSSLNKSNNNDEIVVVQE